MNRKLLSIVLVGTIAAIPLLCHAEDSDPNNPANWKINKSWSGWVQRDIYAPVNPYHEYHTINGVVPKGGWFLTGGTTNGSVTYEVQFFAQCHMWVNWIGTGPAPSSVTIQVGPAAHAEVDDAIGNNFNARASGAGLINEVDYPPTDWTTPGPPEGFWESETDMVAPGYITTVTLAPGPDGGTYDFSGWAYGGLYSGAGEVLVSVNMGASFYSSP